MTAEERWADCIMQIVNGVRAAIRLVERNEQRAP